MQQMSDEEMLDALASVDASLASGITHSLQDPAHAAEWVRRMAPHALGQRSSELLMRRDASLWAEFAEWIRSND